MKEGAKVGEGIYLGDGAYVERIAEEAVEIFTSDGLGRQNRVVLDHDAADFLVKWLRGVFGEAY